MWFERILLCGSIKCEANKFVFFINLWTVCLRCFALTVFFFLLKVCNFWGIFRFYVDLIFGAWHIIYMLHFFFQEILSIYFELIVKCQYCNHFFKHDYSNFTNIYLLKLLLPIKLLFRLHLFCVIARKTQT